MFRYIMRFNPTCANQLHRLYSVSEGIVKFDPNISVKTLKIIQTEPRGAQLFDVRDPNELEEDNRLPGAVNIPLDDIEMAFTLDDADFQAKYGVPKPKPSDDNLVFSCRAGRRSLIACEKVQNLGYEKYVICIELISDTALF
ncbi:unnamed protein product [Rodentolepis nana]|uniref:Rhodanese domain-containing protein n=1 Tax=Rodentolepis nana TaxID=102285 RepID=A0A0R3TDM7_RODNA|nr:unnamed protein product [Rodentolepis nana]